VRTTLDVADDVLHAVKERARREKRTAGEVISDLARRALTGAAAAGKDPEPADFHGFTPFPRRGAVVSNELIDRLREEELD
jgi:hypothetical protein